MKLEIYKNVIKSYRDVTMSMIRENKESGNWSYIIWFARSFEHRFDGINSMALRDSDLSTKDYKVISRYKQRVFMWNLHDKWRNL